MKIQAAAVATLISWATAAHGQSSYHSECGWAAEGVYSCSSTTETPFSTTNTLCASGLNSKCVSKTEPKAPPKPKPSSETTSSGVRILR